MAGGFADIPELLVGALLIIDFRESNSLRSPQKGKMNEPNDAEHQRSCRRYLARDSISQ